MDNCLSVKRGRIVLAVILNLILIACGIFVYIKLTRIQNIIPPLFWNEPGFKEMSLIVLVFKIGLAGLIGFMSLHTANLARLRVYYNEAGIQFKSLFCNWKASWLQVELAYIGRRNLFIKSTGGRLAVPLQLLSGDLDKLVTYIPAEVLLDKDSAVRQEKKRNLKIVLVVMLAGITISVTFERYFKPYLSQAEERMAQAIDKYKKQIGIKTVQKEATK